MKRLIAAFIIFFTCHAFGDVSMFTLTTSAAKNGETMPARYTCDEKDIQPELSWSNPPANTKSFALILSDPDAPNGTFYHWVIYNIPENIHSLPEGMNKLPAEALAGANSWNKLTYNGPCPPRGASHHYVFTLYALDKKLALSSGETADTVLDAMQSHILGQTTLTLTYSRKN